MLSRLYSTSSDDKKKKEDYGSKIREQKTKIYEKYSSAFATSGDSKATVCALVITSYTARTR
jgi:hypothetical protein